MKVIKPYHEILNYTNCLENTIEMAGRVCYKSEDKICEGSAEKLINRLMESHHESVLEHGSITVRIVCDRGVSHELVRHRIASFSQESTRYVNYSKGKYGSEITFIDPCFWAHGSQNYKEWERACLFAECSYMELINGGATAQEARSVLPNSLKTEVVMTANPREWLHVFRMRTANAAHPQMREIMIPLEQEFSQKWPIIFKPAPNVQNSEST